MTCCNGLLMKYEWQTTLSSYQFSALTGFPLKAIEFYGVDTEFSQKFRGSKVFVHIW